MEYEEAPRGRPEEEIDSTSDGEHSSAPMNGIGGKEIMLGRAAAAAAAAAYDEEGMKSLDHDEISDGIAEMNQSLQLSDDEKDTESDDEMRQRKDPMFQALARAVLGQREHQQRQDRMQPVSRRQRTAATVAAEQYQNIMTGQDNISSQKKAAQKKKGSHNGASQRRSASQQTKVKPSLQDLTMLDDFQGSTDHKVTKFIKSTVAPTTADDPVDTDDYMIVKTEKSKPKQNGALSRKKEPKKKTKSMQIKFIQTHDAEIPPKHFKNCNREAPPSFRWIATALHDEEGRRIKLRKGIEVTLHVSLGKEHSQPLVCARPFPGGIYYFKDLTYTKKTSGIWSFRLEATWTNPGKDLETYSHRTILGETHHISVQFKGDPLPKLPALRRKPTSVTGSKRRRPTNGDVGNDSRKQAPLLRPCTAKDLPFVQRLDDSLSNSAASRAAQSIDLDAETTKSQWFLLDPNVLARSQSGAALLADLVDSNQRFYDLIRQELLTTDKNGQQDGLPPPLKKRKKKSVDTPHPQDTVIGSSAKSERGSAHRKPRTTKTRRGSAADQKNRGLHASSSSSRGRSVTL